MTPQEVVELLKAFWREELGAKENPPFTICVSTQAWHYEYSDRRNITWRISFSGDYSNRHIIGQSSNDCEMYEEPEEKFNEFIWQMKGVLRKMKTWHDMAPNRLTIWEAEKEAYESVIP